MKATVFGSTGFIGRALCTYLESLGYDVAKPGREDIENLQGDLGVVFYCIGLTGNFRDYPRETVDANVNQLSRILLASKFSSFVYLSSTRIYGTESAHGSIDESAPITLSPVADKTYDLSKLLGEALCQTISGPDVYIARLANVFGPGMSTNTFLGAVLNSVASNGEVEIGESPASAKDYIGIDDVVSALEELSRSEKPGCYNVASGHPVTHELIASELMKRGFSVSFRSGSPVRKFPVVSIEKLQSTIEFHPASILAEFDTLFSEKGLG